MDAAAARRGATKSRLVPALGRDTAADHDNSDENDDNDDNE